MPYNVEKARKAGLSEAQIADYLGKASGYNVQKARTSGLSDAQIVKYLTTDGYSRVRASVGERLRREGDGLENFGNTLLWGHGPQARGAVEAIGTAVSNVGRRITGQPVDYTAEEAYRGARDASRDLIAEERRKYPASSFITSAAGGVMAPGMKGLGGFIGRGASPTARAVRAGGVGAGVGGVYGHGESGVDGILPGMAFGAGFGALGQRGGEAAVNWLSPRIANSVDPIIAGMAARFPGIFEGAQGGAQGVVTRANERVSARGNAGERKVARVLNTIREEDAAAGFSDAAGTPGMYSRGPGTQMATEVMANSSGPGAGKLRAKIERQKDSAYADTKRDIATGMGGRGDYFETLERLQKNRASAAEAGMAEIGDHYVTLDRDSVVALRSGLSQRAIQEAADLGLSSPDPNIRNDAVALQSIVQRALDGERVTMSVREAQIVSEALLKRADAAFKTPGGGGQGQALKVLGRALRNNARDPDRGGFAEYDAWLKQYASDSDRIAALDLGSNVLKNGMDNSPEAVARELAEMGPGALGDYRKGVGEALLNTVMEAGDVRLMRALLKNESLRQRVRMAFPDDETFAAFLEGVERRVHQANLNNRYVGGSPTYLRQQTRERLEGLGYDLGELYQDVRSPERPFLRALKGSNKGVISDPKLNDIMAGALMEPDEMTRLLNMIQTGQRIERARGLVSRTSPGVVGSNNP